MVIGNKKVDAIIITDANGRVLAVISDTETIEHEGCKVDMIS